MYSELTAIQRILETATQYSVVFGNVSSTKELKSAYLKYALKVDPCVKQIMLTHVDTFNKFENPYYIEEYIGLTDIRPYDLAHSEQLLKAQEQLGAKLQNAAIKLSPLNNCGHLIDVINQICKVKFISYGQTHLSKERI